MTHKSNKIYPWEGRLILKKINQPKSLFLQIKGDNTQSPRQKQKRH